MVAVPFLGLLMAIFETGLMFFNSEGLEAAVQQAARNIMTGQAQKNGVYSAATFVNTYLCPATGTRILPSFVDCTTLIVDVRTASSFSNASTSNSFYKTSSSHVFCPGAPSNTGSPVIVVVRVLYPMPVFLPLLGWFGPVMGGVVNDVPSNPGYKHLLLGTAVFQNEPYPSTNYTAPTGC